MKDLYIGDYEYDDGQSKKGDKYPKQISDPEFSLGARIGLALVFLATALALFMLAIRNWLMPDITSFSYVLLPKPQNPFKRIKQLNSN